MALKAMADNNVNITCQEDARMYDYLAGKDADYIIQGVGDNLAVSSDTTSLLVTLGSGECVIQGRHITNTDSTGVQLTLSQNTTAYLVLRYDLSQSAGNEVSFISTPALEDDDLNNAGVIRDIVLCQYITDANGVATLSDMRNYTTPIQKKGYVKSVNATINTSPQNVALNGDYSSDDYFITWGMQSTITADQIAEMGGSQPVLTSVNTTSAVFRCLGDAPKSGFPVTIFIFMV